MKYAGIHWPENAGGEHPDRSAIVELPGAQGAVLICSPSARFHYNYVRDMCPSATVVWRAIPRAYEGKLPAQLGWRAQEVAKECLNLWDAQHHNYEEEHFLPLNELQFKKESGEDFKGYADVAQKLAGVREVLRRVMPPWVKLMFPGWVPQDDVSRFDEWADEAMKWDTICLHAYGSPDEISTRYWDYRTNLAARYGEAGREKPIFIGEWNSNHGDHDERESLIELGSIAVDDEYFLGATYYIWETNNEGERDLSVWGNPTRYELFQNPPVVLREEPPVPLPRREQLRPYGLEQASVHRVPVEMFDRQIQQESNWEHYNTDGSIKRSRSDALGVAQIIQKWHPAVDVTDPWASLRYAAALMRKNYDARGTWKLALMDYNWGPDNVRKWIEAGSDDSKIRAQTRKYLDVALGPGWPEPEAQVTGYAVGPGIAQLMAEHEDQPATPEHFFGEGSGKYSLAFGKSGAMYVYLFDNNSLHRFPADR